MIEVKTDDGQKRKGTNSSRKFTSRLEFLLTPEQRADIRVRAAKAGLEVGPWIRSKLFTSTEF